MSMMRFGELIRMRRKRLELTLEQVAKKLKMDLTYFSKIEAGKCSPPSPRVIIRLAKLLFLESKYLLLLAFAEKAPKEIQKEARKAIENVIESQWPELRG